MVVREQGHLYFICTVGECASSQSLTKNASEELGLKMAKLSLKYLSKEVNLSNHRGNLDKTLTPLLPFPISF